MSGAVVPPRRKSGAITKKGDCVLYPTDPFFLMMQTSIGPILVQTVMSGLTRAHLGALSGFLHRIAGFPLLPRRKARFQAWFLLRTVHPFPPLLYTKKIFSQIQEVYKHITCKI